MGRPSSNETLINRSILITERQDKYINKKRINLSGWVRDRLDEELDKNKK